MIVLTGGTWPSQPDLFHISLMIKISGERLCSQISIAMKPTSTILLKGLGSTKISLCLNFFDLLLGRPISPQICTAWPLAMQAAVLKAEGLKCQISNPRKVGDIRYMVNLVLSFRTNKNVYRNPVFFFPELILCSTRMVKLF